MKDPISTLSYSVVFFIGRRSIGFKVRSTAWYWTAPGVDDSLRPPTTSARAWPFDGRKSSTWKIQLNPDRKLTKSLRRRWHRRAAWFCVATWKSSSCRRWHESDFGWLSDRNRFDSVLKKKKAIYFVQRILRIGWAKYTDTALQSHGFQWLFY